MEFSPYLNERQGRGERVAGGHFQMQRHRWRWRGQVGLSSETGEKLLPPRIQQVPTKRNLLLDSVVFDSSHCFFSIFPADQAVCGQQWSGVQTRAKEDLTLAGKTHRSSAPRRSSPTWRHGRWHPAPSAVCSRISAACLPNRARSVKSHSLAAAAPPPCAPLELCSQHPARRLTKHPSNY